MPAGTLVSCAACHATWIPGNRFCSACGAAGACSAGHPIGASARFCRSCGERVPTPPCPAVARHAWAPRAAGFAMALVVGGGVLLGGWYLGSRPGEATGDRAKARAGVGTIAQGDSSARAIQSATPTRTPSAPVVEGTPPGAANAAGPPPAASPQPTATAVPSQSVPTSTRIPADTPTPSPTATRPAATPTPVPHTVAPTLTAPFEATLTGRFSLRQANGSLVACEGCWVWFAPPGLEESAGYSSRGGRYEAELRRPDWDLYVECPRVGGKDNPRHRATPPSVFLSPGLNKLDLVVGPCP